MIKARHSMELRKRIRSDSDVNAKAKVRKLSVIEEEDVFVAEAQGGGRKHKARGIKRSNRLSVDLLSSVDEDVTDDAFRSETYHQRPSKAGSVRIKKPPMLKLVPDLPPPEPIVSPIPLPEHVECIDPTDDSNMEYWSDFIKYSKELEEDQMFSSTEILGDESHLEELRRRLVNWLLEVTTYYRVSQETLYHTIRLVDSVLTKRKIKPNRIQLLGLAAFLVAAKLEEYSPPAIKALVKLTQNSYTFNDVIQMEMRILRVNDCVAYAPEPMLFLNRYIAAAKKQDCKLFEWTCTMLVDSLLPRIDSSSYRPSAKAATAVLLALMIHHDHSGVIKPKTVWTPTLSYYSGYKPKHLYPVAKAMLEQLESALGELSESESADGFDQGLVTKYIKSRYGQILEIILVERWSRVEMTKEFFDKHDSSH